MSNGASDGKPFICDYPECRQRFTNEDHFAIHKSKHDMSLHINRGKIVLPDQTPTPTRFLKICDQEGLFDTLNNPFEHEFTKSVSTGTTDSVGDQETPPVVIQDSDHVPAGMSLANSAVFSMSSLTAPTPIISSPYAVASIPVAPPNSIENPKKLVPVATPPNRLPDTAASHQLKLSLRQKLQQENLKKVFLNLPPGMDPASLMGSQVPTTPEIIQEAFKNALSAGGSPFMTPPLLQQSSQPLSPSAYSSEEDGQRRRSRTHDDGDDDDPAHKRRRFLERNRAAAARCRSKKKQWVENLETKAKSLEDQTQIFHDEISGLKMEVQNLKNILMAHRDCPLLVSQQEQLKQLQTVDYCNVLSGGGSVGMEGASRQNSATSSLQDSLSLAKTLEMQHQALHHQQQPPPPHGSSQSADREN